MGETSKIQLSPEDRTTLRQALASVEDLSTLLTSNLEAILAGHPEPERLLRDAGAEARQVRAHLVEHTSLDTLMMRADEGEMDLQDAFDMATRAEGQTVTLTKVFNLCVRHVPDLMGVPA